MSLVSFSPLLRKIISLTLYLYIIYLLLAAIFLPDSTIVSIETATSIIFLEFLSLTGDTAVSNIITAYQKNYDNKLSKIVPLAIFTIVGLFGVYQVLTFIYLITESVFPLIYFGLSLLAKIIKTERSDGTSVKVFLISMAIVIFLGQNFNLTTRLGVDSAATYLFIGVIYYSFFTIRTLYNLFIQIKQNSILQHS